MHMQGFFQTAYVTRNLEKAMATLKERHGVDANFIRFDPDMEVTTNYGGRGRAVMKVALVWVTPTLQIELIEPTSGLVTHYSDFLPADDSMRFHHVGMRVQDWDAIRAEIDKNKWPVTYEGAVEGGKFIYLDARDTLGHYVEYLWLAPEMWTLMGGR